MGKYILKRIALAFVTIWAVATITFFLMNLVPGGPFLSEKAISPAATKALEAKYGLDKPCLLYTSYLLMPFVFCINGLFIGAGHTAFSMVNNMLSAIILRVPVAVVFGLVLNLGLTGVGLGGPMASVGAIILIVVFLISGRWKENKAL